MRILCIFLFTLAHAAPDLSDRIQVGEVAGSPDVKVIRGFGGKEETVHQGDELFVGDQVAVGPRQIVSLEAKDHSRWKIAPGTTMRIEARKPDKQTLSYWSFLVSHGSMWGKVEKPAEASKGGFRLKVRTKMAALGIRGTEYLIRDGDEKSGIDVLEGVVWWGTDLGFAAGTYQEVAAGQHAEIGADGKVRVSPTTGDKAGLVRDYGLVLPAGVSSNGPPNKGTAAQCAAQGLGWRSRDGSSTGECFRELSEK